MTDSKEFGHELPVRFQDVDAGGVLFFGRIYDYLHLAYEEFWAAAGVDRREFFAGASWLVPIAHSEADYRAPIRHGERIRVAIAVIRVGRASFRLRYRVTGAEGDVRATAATVHAFVDRVTMKPIAIPDSLRAFLLAHLIEEPLADASAR